MPRFRAFRLHSTGNDEAPKGRLEDLDIDELSPGDVVIRVAYSSINYKDALAAAGKGRIVRNYPRIGGIDLSGTVVSSSYDGIDPGDEVIVHGFGIGVDADGGHSQYARVSGDWVMPLPSGLSLLDAAICGVAGYTAGLALHWMEHNGLRPDRGEIAITGASGGVGSLAVDMFTGRGYRVCAISGKQDAAAFLESLGAAEVIVPPALQGKPLESARWAGVVDAVGGQLLARLLASVQPEGVVTSFGNAGGAELNTTVLPFILRGVKLLGINANSPMALRREVWQKIASEYRPAHLRDIAQLITLDELPDAMRAMLDRATHGRTIVQMS